MIMVAFASARASRLAVTVAILTTDAVGFTGLIIGAEEVVLRGRVEVETSVVEGVEAGRRG